MATRVLAPLARANTAQATQLLTALTATPLTTRELHTWFQHYQTLEKVNGSYVTDDLRDRADDIIWRVKRQDDWLYIKLLIEFQSQVD